MSYSSTGRTEKFVVCNQDASLVRPYLAHWIQIQNLSAHPQHRWPGAPALSFPGMAVPEPLMDAARAWQHQYQPQPAPAPAKAWTPAAGLEQPASWQCLSLK